MSRLRHPQASIERLEGRWAMAGLSGWHNEIMPADVDADGVLTPLDALVELNGIQAAIAKYGGEVAPGELPPFEVDLPDLAESLVGGTSYIDVNNDGKASIFDYGAVLSALLDGVDPASHLSALPPELGGTTILPAIDSTPPLYTVVTPPPSGPLPPGPLPAELQDVNLPAPPLEPSGLCAVIPAVPGPFTMTKYMNAEGKWVLGQPEFTPLDDADNEGLVVGMELDQVYRAAHGKPFDEGASFLLPLHKDNPTVDDTYYGWLEVVSTRVYAEYHLLPSTTLVNVTAAPVADVRTVGITSTTGWAVTNGIAAVTNSEVALNANAIAAKSTKTLNQSFEFEQHAETTQTMTRALTVTAPPCAVAAIYQGAIIVEVEVDFVKWVDTVAGVYNGFSLERGRLTARSTYDLGTMVVATPSYFPNNVAPAPAPQPIPMP